MDEQKNIRIGDADKMQQIDFGHTLLPSNGDCFPPFQYNMALQMPHSTSYHHQQYSGSMDNPAKAVYKPKHQRDTSASGSNDQGHSLLMDDNNNNTSMSSGVDLHCHEDMEASQLEAAVVYKAPGEHINRPQLDPIFSNQAHAIFDQMIEDQLKYHPTDFLAGQPQVTHMMRGEVIFTHMMKVVNHFSLSRDTLHLSVNLFDRFLAAVPVTESCVPLLAITCLRIASKKEDVNPPSIIDLIGFVGGKDVYEKRQFLRLELLVLRKMDYCLEVPTSLSIMHCLLRMCLDRHGIFLQHGLDEFLTTDCNNLIDNALLSIEFMQYSPACRAAACLQVGLASIFRDHSCGYLRWVNDVSKMSIDELACCTITLQKAVHLAKYQKANLPPSLQYHTYKPEYTNMGLNQANLKGPTYSYFDHSPPAIHSHSMHPYTQQPVCYYDPWNGLVHVDSGFMVGQESIHMRY